MLYTTGKEDDYFKAIGNAIENNRCPYCLAGMMLQSSTFRYCPHCPHSERTFEPISHNLKFTTRIDETTGEVALAASTPDSKISFRLTFANISKSDAYIDEVMKGHIKNQNRSLKSCIPL